MALSARPSALGANVLNCFSDSNAFAQGLIMITATGAYSKTIPRGVSKVQFSMSGGSGGGAGRGVGLFGGSGSLVSGVISVTPGMILTGSVGIGGVAGSGYSIYAGGGADGGGFTSLYLNNIMIAISAGGGGSGTSSSGGDGGGLVGQSTPGAGGGTQSAGGWSTGNLSGGYLTGSAGIYGNGGPGGGGWGYWGGGQGSNTGNYGGGGGSDFISPIVQSAIRRQGGGVTGGTSINEILQSGWAGNPPWAYPGKPGWARFILLA